MPACRDGPNKGGAGACPRGPVQTQVGKADGEPNKKGEEERVSGRSRLSGGTHGKVLVVYPGKCVEKRGLRRNLESIGIVGVNKGKGTPKEQPDVGLEDC